MSKKKISIIGGGPSALSAAYFLAPHFDTTIFEKEQNIGQKFLVAGKGGFNLTNSLTGTALVNKYSPIDFLKEAILNFDSNSTRNWLMSLGIETFIGTSGRVFASKIHKPFEVLENIKKALFKENVKILTKHKFIGFNEKVLPIIFNGSRKIAIESDYYIFALGGASWSKTGSDGKWLELFQNIEIKTKPFEASNCGVNIEWSDNIIDYHIGKPLKNIEISLDNIKSRGEAVITDYGLEGNIIYAIVPKIRELLKTSKTCINLDFKPNNTITDLEKKINEVEGKYRNYKKMLNLNSSELSLIKSYITRNDFVNPLKFIHQLKRLSIPILSLRLVEEAISSVGGIDVYNINSDFSLKKYPNIFTIGEMVDWDAPTGGYLLQGCFSMGHHTAISIISQLL